MRNPLLLLLLLPLVFTSCKKLDEESAKKTVGDFITYLQFDNTKGIQEIYPTFWLERNPIIHSYEISNIMEGEKSIDVLVNTKLGPQGLYEQKMTFTVIENEAGRIIIKSSYGMSKYTWENMDVVYEAAKKHGLITHSLNFDVPIDSICAIISYQLDTTTQSLKKSFEEGAFKFESNNVKEEKYNGGVRLYGNVGIKSPFSLDPSSYSILIDYLGKNGDVIDTDIFNAKKPLESEKTVYVEVNPFQFRHIYGAVGYRFRLIITNDQFIRDFVLEVLLLAIMDDIPAIRKLTVQ